MRSGKRPRVKRGRENTKFLTFDSISTFDIIESDVLKREEQLVINLYDPRLRPTTSNLYKLNANNFPCVDCVCIG